MSTKNPLDLGIQFEKPEPGMPWGNYDFDKPSLVVVASNDDTGAVLWGVGGHIRVEMEEGGLTHLDDLGIHPPSAGVWVWEGIYVWSPGSWECPQDGDSYPVGTWRKPTESEWIAIQKGECPWDDDDWKLKGENPDAVHRD